jgi:hypothetical protein
MQQPEAATEQSEAQRPRHGGRPWPKGVSGNPSGSRANKRAVALFAEMANDFGGPSALSAIDRAMLDQAATLLARSRRVKDPDVALRMGGEARRLLECLRRHAATKAAAKNSSAMDALKARDALAVEDSDFALLDQRTQDKLAHEAYMRLIHKPER